MPKIENCSWGDFLRGHHRLSPENAIAIQITDPGDVPPEPPEDVFGARHSFQFLDAEEPTRFFPEEKLISDTQAEKIASILVDALENNQDVLVHCVVGVCRSGAVVEVAEMIGFDECPRYRQPNTRVKRKLMEQFDLLPYGV
jgi:protein-tyrosine phosphatase